MLLDRIDIDNHGPLNRVELGPFTEHLNVICAPEGSGKTAIARFVRDSLIRREYPLGMMSSSAGRVVWADRNGKIHCRREHDGTHSGRRTIEFESRGDASHRFDWLHGSWVGGIADSTDASRALESIRIPETIVDGIVTDTAVTSVSRVIAACLASGLMDPALFASLPINQSTVSGLSPAESSADQIARRAIRDELARVEAELATYSPSQYEPSLSPRSELIQLRRRQLQSRLSYLQTLAQQSRRPAPLRTPAVDPAVITARQHRAAAAELSQLHDRIWQLRVRHSELSRWLSHLQSDRSRHGYNAPVTASPYASHRGLGLSSGLSVPKNLSPELDAALRDRLQAVDAEIIRWRRVLSELHGLRDAYFTTDSRYQAASESGYDRSFPLSDQVLRRERMNHFLRSLDRYADHPAAFMSHAAASSYWPDEIDLRIEAVIRQIDSLATHYDRSNASAPQWYRELPESHGYRGDASLVRSLHAIRDDLQNARRQGFRFVNESSRHDQRQDELRASERWVIASIQRLMQYRESLVHDQRLAQQLHYPSWLDESYHRESWSPWYVDHLNNEAVARTRELEQVSGELDRCVADASRLRRQMRELPVVDAFSAIDIPLAPSAYGAHYAYGAHDADGIDQRAIQSEIDSIVAELRAMELVETVPAAEFAGAGIGEQASSRVAWLKTRRGELIQKLGAPEPVRSNALPLVEEASQWLVRLSGGRLRRVDWNAAAADAVTRQSGAAAIPGFARIDGLDEAHCPAVDRALAALALRLAAGDLLARTGRAIPLLVETHRELLHRRSIHPHQSAEQAVDLAVIAALDDYAKNGRQVVLLASDRTFADQISRRGGQTFFIHGERVAHEHRPLWRPHYAGESYVGPHGHVAAAAGPSQPPGDVYVDQYFDNSPVGASLADINRNLDAIWQEAYGISPYATGGAPIPAQPHPAQPVAPAHPGPPVATQWHDGYYFADSYTTAGPVNTGPVNTGAAQQARNGQSLAQSAPPESARNRAPVSPFFLTVDSPIDQAPSVDAVAASRLRGLSVTHVNHLMNQDPNRLADSLGLAGVTAATIRRWQSECRLVCHVPQLRAFDARVLVGCGIIDAGHLSSIDPIDLLDRVEAFLATERGQRILLSGTSYELSRITSWIAAANVNTDDAPLIGDADFHTVDGRVIRQTRQQRVLGQDTTDSDRYEYEFVDDNGHVVRARSTRPRGAGRRSSGQRDSRSTGRRVLRSGGSRHQVSSNHHGGETATGSREARTARRNHQLDRAVYQRSGQLHRSESRSDDAVAAEGQRESRQPVQRVVRQSSQRSAGPDQPRSSRVSPSETNDAIDESGSELRFYLERESPIVDAPSIGNRMAAKLEAVGITTVNDLLDSDPSDLAEWLDHRRIDADTIIAWQNQAILVCRVPLLRGHDAQLLVAAGVTTPEEVAAFDANELLVLIDPIARSNEGKRILRGGKLPDLEEISLWIQCAGQHRELLAA
ncbi:DUF4332 domain-containing protein [Stieleria sp. TO1_6]|uniref:DUF4332 domain-containing protein n=1 Tax=Stieleria tagensis TaxID=2956795 RepID=UPI00209B8B7C|nr:DUF4332 domain-containing protein [Stieleria tagensis]MCO8124642.1 DUF4332 domain-containing protein [Stieleria tagensis]